MDELASVVEELEDTLVVEDVEDLREANENFQSKELATIRETHAKGREKRGIAVTTLLRQPLLTLLQRHWSRERKEKT